MRTNAEKIHMTELRQKRAALYTQILDLRKFNTDLSMQMANNDAAIANLQRQQIEIDYAISGMEKDYLKDRAAALRRGDDE